MTNNTLDLLIFQCESVGSGYALAQKASQLGLRILELSYLGMGTFLILQNEMPENSMKSLMNELESSMPDQIQEVRSRAWFKDFPSEIFKKYLNMTITGMAAPLDIYETESIVEMFQLAETIPADKIIEFRVLRGSRPGAVLMTSLVDIANLGRLQLKKMKHTRLNAIPEGFKEYFDIIPT